METLGERVARLRKARGLTNYQLAARVGVNHASIIRIESGEHLPRAASLKPLARALGCSTDMILTGREAPQLAALQRAILAGTSSSALIAMVQASGE